MGPAKKELHTIIYKTFSSLPFPHTSVIAKKRKSFSNRRSRASAGDGYSTGTVSRIWIKSFRFPIYRIPANNNEKSVFVRVYGKLRVGKKSGKMDGQGVSFVKKKV